MFRYSFRIYKTYLVRRRYFDETGNIFGRIITNLPKETTRVLEKIIP